MWRYPTPACRTGQAQLIEDLRIVIGDAAAQDLALPSIRGSLKTLHLLQDFQRAAIAQHLARRCNVLPAQQPAHELGRCNGSDLLSQRTQGQAVDTGEQATLAPLDFPRREVGEFAAQDRAR